MSDQANSLRIPQPDIDIALGNVELAGVMMECVAKVLSICAGNDRDAIAVAGLTTRELERAMELLEPVEKILSDAKDGGTA